MDFLEISIYILRIYIINYFGSLVMVFSGIPIGYVRCFQIIMYIIGSIYLCLAIFYRYKNYKIEQEIKKAKKKEIENSNNFTFKRDYRE
jgi:hypothetical protein